MINRNCTQCKKDFKFRGCPTDIASGRGKFCSKQCKKEYETIIPNKLICKNCRIIFKKKNGHFRKYCSHKCYSKSLIGRVPQNKGKKFPKISERMKGNKNSVGERNVNWEGGITPINEKIRKSLKYKNWRLSVFKRDNYICIFCKIKGGKLNADHIKPFSLYPRLRFDMNNGRTLCVDCHKLTDTYGKNITKKHYIKTFTPQA